jgi:hypothetical protein
VQAEHVRSSGEEYELEEQLIIEVRWARLQVKREQEHQRRYERLIENSLSKHGEGVWRELLGIVEHDLIEAKAFRDECAAALRWLRVERARRLLTSARWRPAREGA